MRKGPWTVRLISAVTVVMLTSGCETANNWLKGRQTATASDPVILGAPNAGVYLAELYALTSGDPATQAEIYVDSESAARLAPSTSTRLRYALVVATSGHSETDEAMAQEILRDLLSQSELMTSAEVALASIYLQDVETRMVLDAEARRLRAENSAAASTEESAISRRVARVEARNRQLRTELADAEAKLEAILSIDRSIREQADANNR